MLRIKTYGTGVGSKNGNILVKNNCYFGKNPGFYRRYSEINNSGVKPPGDIVKKPVTVNKKAESHKFRNFIISSIISLGILYGGGVYYSLKDDSFKDYFNEYVPYGEPLVSYFEDIDFNRRFPDIKRRQLEKSKVVTIPKDGVVSSIVVELDDNSKKIETKAATDAVENAKNAAKNAASDAASNATSNAAKNAEKPKTLLPNVELKGEHDVLVLNTVKSINELINSMNKSEMSEEQISSICNEINKLSIEFNNKKTQNIDKDVDSNKKKYKKQISKLNNSLEIEKENFKQELLENENKWIKEISNIQQELIKQYNLRLSKEIYETEKSFNEKLKNQLILAEIKRDEDINKKISNLVETERNGRLSKLKEISKSLLQLDEISLNANKIIDESDRISKIQVTTGLLKSAVEEPEAVPLKKYLNSLKDLYKDDELVKSVIESFPSKASTDGVLSSSELIKKFKQLEVGLRKSSYLPANAGVAGHISSWILSKFTFRRDGNSSGEDIESVISRTETALSEGRVEDAVREINSLQGWPKVLSEDWLLSSRQRSEVDFLTDVLVENAKLCTTNRSK